MTSSACTPEEFSLFKPPWVKQVLPGGSNTEAKQLEHQREGGREGGKEGRREGGRKAKAHDTRLQDALARNGNGWHAILSVESELLPLKVARAPSGWQYSDYYTPT